MKGELLISFHVFESLDSLLELFKVEFALTTYVSLLIKFTGQRNILTYRIQDLKTLQWEFFSRRCKPVIHP